MTNASIAGLLGVFGCPVEITLPLGVTLALSMGRTPWQALAVPEISWTANLMVS
jgi:hypothetical protein